ncbi:bactericidal permeability-increasing protein [Octopus sinensis]|uniref:Bactericidal permeability-increasing protein n=1 Tax=Octopus sinensis TaxID=2607531 RepID=A0A6P7SBA7_9MOLL|nr:bactericidal permeability-increasing protein [Octopus sinensis]
MNNKIQVFAIPTGLLFLSLFIFVKTQTTTAEDNVTNEEQPSVQNNSDIGFIMRITAQGFDYGAQLGADVLYQKLKHMNYIPDLITKQNGVEMTITNLSIVDFSPPVGNAELIPDHGVRWILSINHTKVSGYWNYITRAWFTFQDEGSFLAVLHETTLNITIEITRSSYGGFVMTVSECESIINLEMNLGSWLYNIVASLAQPFLENILQSQLCDIATGIIKVDAMSILEKLPVNITFQNNYVMDYSMLEPPYFTEDYMETYHKGEITWKGDKEGIPFKPMPLVPLMETDRMLYLQISDHVFNSYCYAAFSHNMLSFEVTNDNLPGNILSTTCESGGLCIGRLLPKIGEQFPNESISLSVFNNLSPHWTFDDTIQLNFKGILNFYIPQKNGRNVSIFMIDLDLKAHMSAFIKDSRLYSQIVKFTFKTINRKNSLFGENFNFYPLTNMVIKKYVIPRINDQGRLGIPLVMMSGTMVINTELKIQKHTLTLGTDFEIKHL